MVIEGDNLQVMLSLRSQYSDSFDVVYIDPPFPGQWECWGLGCGGECGGSGSDVEAGAVAA